jgi:hypothetical protein
MNPWWDKGKFDRTKALHHEDTKHTKKNKFVEDVEYDRFGSTSFNDGRFTAKQTEHEQSWLLLWEIRSKNRLPVPAQPFTLHTTTP